MDINEVLHMTSLQEGCPYYGWDRYQSMDILKYFLKKYFNIIKCKNCMEWVDFDSGCVDEETHEDDEELDYTMKLPSMEVLTKLGDKLGDEYNDLFLLYILKADNYWCRETDCLLFVLEEIKWSCDQGSDELEDVSPTPVSSAIITELGIFPNIWAGVTMKGYYI